VEIPYRPRQPSRDFAQNRLTFAAGLRSILRQDPNIIWSVKFATLRPPISPFKPRSPATWSSSTLHTNDAVATVHRLINMKVEPFLLAAALGGVMAQRLLRRLCERCKQEHKLTKAEVESLGGALN